MPTPSEIDAAVACAADYSEGHVEVVVEEAEAVGFERSSDRGGSGRQHDDIAVLSRRRGERQVLCKLYKVSESDWKAT